MVRPEARVVQCAIDLIRVEIGGDGSRIALIQQTSVVVVFSLAHRGQARDVIFVVGDSLARRHHSHRTRGSPVSRAGCACLPDWRKLVGVQLALVIIIRGSS